MLKIKIVAMGKLTEPAFKAASDEYLARLNKNFSVTVAEPKPEPLPQNPSDNAIKLALDKEADKILAEISPRSALVAMCVEGKELSSEEFSQKLSDFALSGFSEVAFVIGSSYGLSDKVKNAAKLKLSVSKMTFPHELFRVMLLEQIYRAGEIQSGSKYHK